MDTKRFWEVAILLSIFAAAMVLIGIVTLVGKSEETVADPNMGVYYHPYDQRAYQCPDCYGGDGDLCPGHWEPNEVEQVHHWGWGKIPKQNLCPHCDSTSYKRFCTHCKKERGNLPFIGVYCPKCKPEGKYASVTEDLTKICGDCGSNKTWKFVYEDWQTDPNEPNILLEEQQ